MTQNNSPTNKPYNIILPLVLLIGILGFSVYQTLSRNIANADNNNEIDKECYSRALAEIGGPFDLIKHDGTKFTQNDLLGKPALIYFGYTYCPDVCPTSLTYMGKALSQLEIDDKRLYDEMQSVFVTIDPERDTPQKMAEYIKTPVFPKKLIGLTGSVAQIEKAAKVYKVAYSKDPNPQKSDAYTMSHSSLFYLIGRDGKLSTYFSDNEDPVKMTKCMIALNKKGL